MSLVPLKYEKFWNQVLMEHSPSWPSWCMPENFSCHLEILQEAIRRAIWQTQQQFVTFLSNLSNKLKDNLCDSTLLEIYNQHQFFSLMRVLNLGNNCSL